MDNHIRTKKIRCSFWGCQRMTLHPYADGWATLTEWGPSVKNGFYCQVHIDALGAALLEGGPVPFAPCSPVHANWFGDRGLVTTNSSEYRSMNAAE